MNDILEKAFDVCFTETDTGDYSKTMQWLTSNHKLLKKRLNKRERKLLLRVLDAKDLIAEEKSLYCYIEGFKLGLKVGYETNRK